jgi:hypothetical protein
MPYIKQKDRCRLDAAIQNANTPFMLGTCVDTAGELNYLVTKIIRGYFVQNGGNYQAINDVVGALEGAKAEFQRRVVAKYEDMKIEDNGDVY